VSPLVARLVVEELVPVVAAAALPVPAELVVAHPQ
jgi:hypothetical protein